MQHALKACRYSRVGRLRLLRLRSLISTRRLDLLRSSKLMCSLAPTAPVLILSSPILELMAINSGLQRSNSNLNEEDVDLLPIEDPGDGTASAGRPDLEESNHSLNEGDMDLLPVESSDGPTAPSKRPELGKPARKTALFWMDFAVLSIVWISFSFSITIIYPQKVAVYLGQTNRLIIIGICLTIMALCTKTSILSLAILEEVRCGTSTLQNLDALLRGDAYANQIAWFTRTLLFSLFALPLVLSASYKRFVGGSSSITISSTETTFGLTGAPGMQKIGLGSSLIVELYLPFWNAPNFPQTYGFNLFIPSNFTAAVLDGPFPENVIAVQKTLGKDETILLTAEVNATVSEEVSIPDTYISNETWWHGILEHYYAGVQDDMRGHHYIWLYLGGGHSFENQTLSFLSVFDNDPRVSNQTDQDAFKSKAHMIITTRRLCTATWEITPSTITLTDAILNQTATHAQETVNQSLIVDNTMYLARLFHPLVQEYDWERWPRNTSTNTAPALIAAIIWGRLVSQREGQKYRSKADVMLPELNHYVKAAENITTIKRRTTLKRKSMLFLLLIIQPLLATAAIIAKVFYRKMPVGEGFGIISLLAAVKPQTLCILKGAALSGKLSRKVFVSFEKVGADVDNDDMASEQIKVALGKSGRPAKVRRDTLYG